MRIPRPPDPPRLCNCPSAGGQIRHQRATCTDPVVAQLDWYADIPGAVEVDASRECNCTCQVAGCHDPDCAVYGPPQEPERPDTPADSGRIAAPLTDR